MNAKRFFLSAALLTALAACGGSDDEEPPVACGGPCPAGQVCFGEAGQETCQTPAQIHTAAFTSAPANGDGTAITTACLSCHPQEGADVFASSHWNWTAPTPGLVNPDGTAKAGTFGKDNVINNFCIAVDSNEGRCSECHAGYGDPATQRAAYQIPGVTADRIDCLACHADLSLGYKKAQTRFGVADVQYASCSPACASTEVCIVPVGETAPTCVPAFSAADGRHHAKISAVLLASAQTVRMPGRDNCGRCHFNAGGGDNVKMADLASSLADPTLDMDVHMGSVVSGGLGYTCAECHNAGNHAFKGSGVSVGMVQEAPLACADCHSAAGAAGAPHAGSAFAAQIAMHGRLACQTCHIAEFSRVVATKMDWRWGLAGYKDCRFPVSLADEAAWGDLDTDGNGYADAFPGGATCAAPAASPSVRWTGADGRHYEYDWRKGVFFKESNVLPTYRFYGDQGTHLAVGEAFPPTGTITMAAPYGAADGAVLSPFKRMSGNQPAMDDGSFVPVPHLFGLYGLWSNKPNPSTDAALANPLDAAAQIPVLPATTAVPSGTTYPNKTGAAYASYDEFVADVWDDIVGFGSAKAGVIQPVGSGLATRAATSGLVTVPVGATVAAGYAAGDRVLVMATSSADARFPPGVKVLESVDAGAGTITYHETQLKAPTEAYGSSSPVNVYEALRLGVDWSFAETEMFMNINHEVQPSSTVSCSNCHGDSTREAALCAGFEEAGIVPAGYLGCGT